MDCTKSIQQWHLQALDGLRGIAIILVCLDHWNFLCPDHSLPIDGLRGVDIFFVLSGFLITKLLMIEITRSGTISLKRFYTRRILRLLPAFLFLQLLAAATVHFLPERQDVHLSGIDYLSTFLYFANWRIIWLNKVSLGPLSHLWSLSIEEQFYIIFPGFMLLASRVEMDRKATTRLMVILFLLSLCSYFLLFNTSGPLRAYYGTDTRVFALLAGVLTAFSAAISQEPKVRSLLSKIQPFICVFLLLSLMRFLDSGIAWYFSKFALVSILTALLILTLETTPTSLITEFFSLSPLRSIGRVSYGIYLYHYLVIWILLPMSQEISPFLLLTYYLGATILLTLTSWRYFEAPALRLKTRFKSRL